MKIFCFSFNSPPLNDPEAFCTARFVSSLAQAGLDVELLTIQHPQQVEKSVCEELLHPSVKVIRFPLAQSGRLKISELIRYQYFSEYSEYLEPLIKQVREHLGRSENAILITRGFPSISNVVGYWTRDLVRAWIAHFSDPFPALGAYSGLTRHLQIHDTWWAKRILNAADIVSVTNRNAIRWFRVQHGLPDSTKFHITNHVGSPSLDTKSSVISLNTKHINFVHVGFWGRRRFMADVFREFGTAYAKNPLLILNQFGPVDPGVPEQVKAGNIPWLSLNAGLISPRMSTALLQSQSVNVVIDQNDGLSFCPYLASKFAYAVTSGQPLLAIGQRDSEMCHLFNEYGSFYFSDITNPNELRDTLLEIQEIGINNLIRPNNALTEKFSPTEVAKKFISVIELFS